MGTSAPSKQQNGKINLFLDGWEIDGLVSRMSDKAFVQFCLANPNLRIERDPLGNIFVMPPVSLDSGKFELEIGADLTFWNRRTQLGEVFSSSTMFALPDKSMRMPDAAWIAHENLARLSAEERRTFAQIVPDFVVEVRSPTDRIKVLQEKMRTVWIANGVRLAWLFDVEKQEAWIYRADGSETHISDFEQVLLGETVLPGFELDLKMLKSRK